MEFFCLLLRPSPVLSTSALLVASAFAAPLLLRMDFLGVEVPGILPFDPRPSKRGVDACSGSATMLPSDVTSRLRKRLSKSSVLMDSLSVV